MRSLKQLFSVDYDNAPKSMFVTDFHPRNPHYRSNLEYKTDFSFPKMGNHQIYNGFNQHDYKTRTRQISDFETEFTKEDKRFIPGRMGYQKGENKKINGIGVPYKLKMHDEHDKIDKTLTVSDLQVKQIRSEEDPTFFRLTRKELKMDDISDVVGDSNIGSGMYASGMMRMQKIYKYVDKTTKPVKEKPKDKNAYDNFLS